jgi:hypothetical protein
LIPLSVSYFCLGIFTSMGRIFLVPVTNLVPDIKSEVVILCCLVRAITASEYGAMVE